jgi:TRAP transporter TatT component family protein
VVQRAIVSRRMVTPVRAAPAGSIFVLLLSSVLVVSACSPKQMALNRMASAMASATSVYESDNDPEFVRLAAPGTLKTIEMLLTQSPDHPQLLLTACRGFTEYSYGFLQVEAEVRAADAAAASDLRTRAGKMYQRARGYCLHALEVKHPGLTKQALASDPAAALNQARVDEVPLLYWAAASWGAELSLAQNQLARIAEVATVRALLNRAKALNDGWDRGAIYEALIAFDGLSPLLGGSPARARADFEKAMQLSDGKSVFAHVALAATLTDRAEKRRLLEQALAIDVSTLTSRRLTNLIAQRYARALLATGR